MIKLLNNIYIQMPLNDEKELKIIIKKIHYHNQSVWLEAGCKLHLFLFTAENLKILNPKSSIR